MIKPETLLNMTNEELRECLSEEVNKSVANPEWKRRLEEYHQNIERDFQEEWSNKHFKWFCTKRRQKKLRAKIYRRYTAPVFWLIEEVVDDLLVKQWQNPDFFGQLVEVKKIHNCNTSVVCEFCGSKDVKVETATNFTDPMLIQKYHRIKCCNCGKILLKDYEENNNEKIKNQ